VPVGAQYFAATTYTGNGTTQSLTNTVNGISFQPDFVWVKNRTTAINHILVNSVAGPTLFLNSNTTNAESNTAGVITALNSNGFSVGSVANVNQNTNALVGWQWRASNASAVTNTSGTITSSVSANQTAGFSIVSFSIPATSFTNATVGHGLGVAPKMIIVKSRSVVTNWIVNHASIGSTSYLVLNSTAASATDSTSFNGTSSTTFTLGNSTFWGSDGRTEIAYCFAAVPGYSAFGSYTGNGSTDGPFVYLGFRPAFVMWKRTDSTSDWEMVDKSRPAYNVVTGVLYANLANAEATSSGECDFTANGFKIRDNSNRLNTNGGTYIYMAFAENPFKNSLAR
jgi:hypothetical protein